MANGLVNELREVKPRDAVRPRPRDVRASQAPLRALVLRWQMPRRLLRIVLLGALDVAGILLAIVTALELKVLLVQRSNLSESITLTGRVAPLVCLVTLLLFARSSLYADRGLRPGFTRI